MDGVKLEEMRGRNAETLKELDERCAYPSFWCMLPAHPPPARPRQSLGRGGQPGRVGGPRGAASKGAPLCQNRGQGAPTCLASRAQRSRCCAGGGRGRAGRDREEGVSARPFLPPSAHSLLADGCAGAEDGPGVRGHAASLHVWRLRQHPAGHQKGASARVLCFRRLQGSALLLRS